jgi:dTDP-4-dehydrorhamnose reductase
VEILVLGAGGMVGHTVTVRLLEYGHNVTGFARRKLNFCNTIIGDATSYDLPDLVKNYDVVVNCIGCLVKSVEMNPKNGIFLNSYLPHLLAENSKKVIHLSTDCVFSGHDTPQNGYTENSFRSADYLYGRTKAIGELKNDKDLTFRMSVIGPDINKDGIGLFNWFMKQENVVNGYTTAIWSGVTTIALAEAINEAIKQNLTGLYHLVNNKNISKFDLLKLFNNLRSENIDIVPNSDVNENKTLFNSRKDFNYTVPSYEDMVNDMGKWIENHREFYPHYE